MKAKKSNTESKQFQGIHFLLSFNMLVFKNSKWPTSVYVLIVSKGTRHMFMDMTLSCKSKWKQ